jgi:ferredoxin
MSDTPRQAAQRAWQDFPIRPTTLVGYRSEGRVLAIGPAERLAELPFPAAPSLIIHTLATETGQLDRNHAHSIPQLAGAVAVEVTGHLGAFRVGAEIGGLQVDVNRELAAGMDFDLILDLQETPSIARAVLPIGYRQAGPGQAAEAMAELAEYVGEFDKPKFFEHEPEICAHGASRIEGCRACLEVCGAGAIRSERLKIEVDPYLCQGCGDCATVCPAGAMNYLYPRRGDTLERLRRMLDAWFDAGGEPPVLLLHDGEAGAEWLATHRDDLAGDCLPFPVEALGAAGPDCWLSALAYGCRSVRLLAVGATSAQTAMALESQRSLAEDLLVGLGYPSGLIRLVEPPEPGVPGDTALGDLPRARHAGDDDKRTAIRLALNHLHQHAPRRPATLALAAGAPFGEIRVDPARCTLCMACVSICPEHALADGGDQPRLSFIEANCVQCGLCRAACPEDAIALAPRYLFDPQDARRPRTLHEEEVFHCIACGKPFATAALIRVITARLQGHAMFQGDRLKHLRMCEDCRVKALFTA